jgi:hypothetical protein
MSFCGPSVDSGTPPENLFHKPLEKQMLRLRLSMTYRLFVFSLRWTVKTTFVVSFDFAHDKLAHHERGSSLSKLGTTVRPEPIEELRQSFHRVWRSKMDAGKKSSVGNHPPLSLARF